MLAEAFGPRSAVGLVFVLAAALVASVAWPLATYTLTLGLFGVAHVLAELRYVDVRFGPRLRRSVRRGLVGGLAGIVVVRVGGLAGLLDPTVAVVLELAFAAALVGVVLPVVARAGRGPLTLALATVFGLGAAIVVSPVAALLGLAILHNFTPWGFVLESASPTHRPAVRRFGALVFVLLPSLIVAGWAWLVVEAVGIAAPEVTPLGYGPLTSAMRTYVPATLRDPMLQYHWFCACVFLQCVHYVAVLWLLPRISRTQDVGTIRWPSSRTWLLGLAATMALVAAFASDFTDARRGYGVLAAVHAWVELPLLLLAFAGLPAMPSTRRPGGRSTSG